MAQYRTMFTLLLVAMVATCTWCQEQASPQEWSPDELPDPRLRQQKYNCRPGRERGTISNICDPNQLLTAIEADDLDQLINDVRKFTDGLPLSCGSGRGKGYIISVGLVYEMRRRGDTDVDSRDARLNLASQFTRSLELRWSKNNGQLCDEDIVIFYSARDMVIYAVTGAAAKARISNDDLSRILTNAQEFFGPGRDVGRGLRQVVTDMREVLKTGQYTYSTDRRRSRFSVEGVKIAGQARKRTADSAAWRLQGTTSMTLLLISKVFLINWFY